MKMRIGLSLFNAPYIKKVSKISQNYNNFQNPSMLKCSKFSSLTARMNEAL